MKTAISCPGGTPDHNPNLSRKDRNIFLGEKKSYDEAWENYDE